MTNNSFESVTSLSARLELLQAEHRDLDEMITHLTERPTDDELLVHRLKKRKLMLTDRILLIQRMIMPDVPA